MKSRPANGKNKGILYRMGIRKKISHPNIEDGTLAEILKAWEMNHRHVLSNKDYILVRVDGKAFHNYTKNLDKPFDEDFTEAMNYTMLKLCENVAGVRIGYVQSDEISLLITGFKNIQVSESNPEGLQIGELWMGGVQEKIVSLTAAYASCFFNEKRNQQGYTVTGKPAVFDSRAWSYPGTSEGETLVDRYFMWRQIDARKNSVHMYAHTVFGHKKLLNKNTQQKQQMLTDNDTSWENLEDGYKFGRMACKEQQLTDVSFVDKRTGETKTLETLRNIWVVEDATELKTKILEATPKPPKS